MEEGGGELWFSFFFASGSNDHARHRQCTFDFLRKKKKKKMFFGRVFFL